MNSNSENHGFVCTPGEGQRLLTGARLKVSSAQTGGAFEVIELEGPGGPTPHVHHNHDECFWIITGVFTFTLATAQLDAPANSVVFVPRGIRHAFKPSQGARALLFVIPAGLEGFFRELGEGFAAGRSEAEIRAALAGKYDSEPVR